MATIRDYMDKMRAEGKTPHFTNMPGEATPDSFSYNEDEFTAETERQLETPGTGFDYTPPKASPAEVPGSPPMSETPPGEKIPPKPPEDLSHPEGQRDFKDRQKYSDFVIAKMGFDPFTLDPEKEIEAAQETLPDVFEAAFGGRVLFRDMDKLDKDEKKHWNTIHREFNAHIKNSTKEKIARGKEEYKARMKVFEDKQAEKKALPGAVEKSLSSIFISTNEDGKKIGKIPAGILAKANKDAEKLINSGNMTGAEAVAKITDDLVRERMRVAAIDEALAEIPDMKTGWFNSDAKNVENVKSVIKDAMEQGAEHKEIVSTLKDRGWDSKNIAKVMPKKGEESYEKRTDGTPKGKGYFGNLKRTDGSGKVSGELSIGVSFDGKDTLIPSMVPTLTKDEIDFLLKTKPSPDIFKTPIGKNILKKAVDHAKMRMSKGLSPFAQEGETGGPQQEYKTPTDIANAVRNNEITREEGKRLFNQMTKSAS